MTKRITNSPRRKSDRARKHRAWPAEERAAEVATVAWTVSVIAVFVTDLAAIAVHWYRLNHSESKPAALFEATMLLSAVIIGLASLTLLPIVWRVRKVKPPLGFTMFAGCVAAAPVLVVLLRLLA